MDITDDEFKLYQDICRSYDRPNFKGEELFRDLFITDDKGIIVFIRPPSVKATSMECFLFISALFQHQHVRLMENKVERLCQKLEDKIKSLPDTNQK